uniref:Uncharacterized protein n=1 Tax=Rhizophagus irregularis (strain DAOM 181602 / DAOM 197198 / MUCL 43194) TaxID=747089 RepID=U9UCI2_RHIID
MDSFGLVQPDGYEICKECNYRCNAIRFQQNFKDWTSGNEGIDKFIQDTQLSAHTFYEVNNALEWIPYDKLYDIKYITKDELGKVYRANWFDGNIIDKYYSYNYWGDVLKHNWKRNYPNMFVNLKSLNSPNDLTFELANKVVY